MDDIVEHYKGVSFPDRYGHKKPVKPVNTAFLTLHRFKVTLFACAFRVIFTLVRVRNFVLGLFACEYILVGKSLLLSRKFGHYQAKLCTITQKSILAGKTLIQTRKPAGSFRDNIRVSVFVYE